MHHVLFSFSVQLPYDFSILKSRNAFSSLCDGFLRKRRVCEVRRGLSALREWEGVNVPLTPSLYHSLGVTIASQKGRGGILTKTSVYLFAVSSFVKRTAGR